jgi:ribonuclease Z
MQFDLVILGSNGAIAAFDRHPSSHILNYNGSLFMIDCGEGTQFQMVKFGIKPGRLDHIFITHLHGDHYFGLIGILTSLNLNWREHDLHIYAPAGLEEIVSMQFGLAGTPLKYKIHFHHTQNLQPEVIFEDAVMQVVSFPLKHRIPTTGFVFREKRNLRKILVDKIAEHKIPYEKITGIKQGLDFKDEQGHIIPNAELTLPPPHPRSYAYCSDTAYTENFLEQIRGVNVLYHEATFVSEHAARADETFHSTSEQAAKIARAAGAGKLIIGHFSARYQFLDLLLAQAREVFPETYLAIEGITFQI